MDRENVDRKIRACLALAAPGSGATPAERATAAAMADKLRKQHGTAERAPEPAWCGVVIRFNSFAFVHDFRNGTSTVEAW